MIEKPDLNEQEIQQNYDEFIEFLKNNFDGEKLEKLLFMYSIDELGTELSLAPASLSENFHFCFPNGYLQHIMRVVKSSEDVEKLWKKMGGKIDYTKEERLTAALHHDLGKIGNKELGTYYVLQDNDWKLRQGELYKLNPDLQYMEASERALFTLQQYGIKITWKETLGIRLADGLYKESNKSYLVQFRPEMYLKTCLPRIIHIADYLSATTERDIIEI